MSRVMKQGDSVDDTSFRQLGCEAVASFSLIARVSGPPSLEVRRRNHVTLVRSVEPSLALLQLEDSRVTLCRVVRDLPFPK